MPEPTRYTFHFKHRGRVVSLGPHENWAAAKDAFQFRYGYWPEILVGADEYVRGDA